MRNEDVYDSAGAKEAGPAKREGWQKAALFWGPACCDICGTTVRSSGER